LVALGVRGVFALAMIGAPWDCQVHELELFMIDRIHCGRA
jgi:hypothetical protein